MTTKMNDSILRQHPAGGATMFKRKPRNMPMPVVRYVGCDGSWEVYSWLSDKSIPKWFKCSWDTAKSFVDNGALIDDLSYEHFLEISNGV